MRETDPKERILFPPVTLNNWPRIATCLTLFLFAGIASRSVLKHRVVTSKSMGAMLSFAMACSNDSAMIRRSNPLALKMNEISHLISFRLCHSHMVAGRANGTRSFTTRSARSSHEWVTSLTRS